MNIQENAWWLIFGLLWTIFLIGSLAFGAWWLAVYCVLSLGVLATYARIAAVQRARIRYLRITVASLERSLKEAHRHDR